MTRIETQQVQNNYDKYESNAHRTESTDNTQLMVPASYAAVGGTFELLMLMLEASKAQKDGARESRVAAEASLGAVQKAQVQDIRDKAALQMAKGITSGTLTAGAAGLELGGAAAKINATEMKQKSDALKNENPALSEQLLKDANLEDRRGVQLEAAGKFTNAGATAIGGLFDRAITGKEADSTEKQHQADALKRSVERLSSELDEIKGNEGKLISYARDIEAAKVRCTQIALQAR